MKRAARIVAVLGAATVAACFSKPGAPHVDDGGGVGEGGSPGDARNDGPADGPPDGQLACGTQDDFNNPAIVDCLTWGTATKSSMATISRANGTLDFNFTGSTASAQCTTNVPFKLANGTSVHVVSYANATTIFSLNVGGQVVTFTVNYITGMYSWNFMCPGYLSNPAMSLSPPPGWLQMKVSVPGAGVRVGLEFSPSGAAGTWNEAFNCTFPSAPPVTGNVTLMGSGSGTSSVKFDDFNIKNCPPP